MRVFEFHQKHDLSVGALGVCRVIKSVEVLFEGFDFFVFVVNYLPDMTVGSTADFFDDFELAENVGFEVLAHIFIYLRCYFIWLYLLSYNFHSIFS